MKRQSKAAAEKRYADLFEQTFTATLAQVGRESAAADHAYEVVRQRRHADELDASRPGLPAHETPSEHTARYTRIRVSGHSYDEAKALMFAEDVRAMKAARPEWDADRCAQEVRDRGFYGREGYQWTVRLAQAALSESVAA